MTALRLAGDAIGRLAGRHSSFLLDTTRRIVTKR
jgi:hypothetical protein